MKKVFLAGVLMAGAMSANAELMKIDVDVAGDNRAVVDTNTGIEWLNLVELKGNSIADVQNKLNDEYAGWRLPTEAEVLQLFEDYIVAEDLSVYGSPIISGKETFVEAFGFTGSDRIQAGYLREGLDNSFSNAAIIGNNVYAPQYENLKVWVGTTRKWSYVSVFLVNDGGVTLSSIEDPSINIPRESNASVPLTGSALLLTAGLMGFRRARKS